MSEGYRDYKSVESGSFPGGHLAVILKTIKKDKRTGELNISSRDGDGFIAVYRGSVAMVFSPGMYVTLKEHLGRQGLLGEAHIKELLEIQKVAPNNIPQSPLIEKGYVSRESFFRALKGNCELVLRSMLSWSGLYRFYEDSYANVPEEILIDIDEIASGHEGITQRYGRSTATGASYGDLLGSVLKKAGIPKDLRSDKVREALDTVSKRLGAFKPKEVVVIVDENPTTGKLLSDSLIGFGFEVERFNTAGDALKRIDTLEAQKIPVVIVMDLMVKGFNDENEPYGGNDLLVYIKDNHPYIPIIIVTSVTDTKIKLESLFLGASYFMNRPQTGSSDQDLPSSEWDVFVEEISYYIWNILKGRRHLIEKEELSFAEDDIINSVLETSSPSAIGHQDVLGAKILIADDELHIRNAIREYLAQDGFSSIDLAENGQQAIEDFSAKRHDVVIVDIVMPKKNGIEVLKEIKARSPNSQVVIITGNADKDSAIAAVRLGAFDYVEKPFDFGALTRTVHKAIDKKILLDRRQLQG